MLYRVTLLTFSQPGAVAGNVVSDEHTDLGNYSCGRLEGVCQAVVVVGSGGDSRRGLTVCC